MTVMSEKNPLCQMVKVKVQLIQLIIALLSYFPPKLWA